MGIDISAKLIYGLNYSDLPEEILEEVNEMLDMGDLDYAIPYYDAPRDEWIVGVDVGCYGCNHREFEKARDSLEWDIPEVISDLELKFYATPHVS